MLLTEQLLLLSLDETTGKISSSTAGYFAFGLGGALLFDLYFLQRIRFEEEKVVPVDLSPLNDPLLDFVMTELGKANKPRKILEWIDGANRKYYEIRDLLYARFQAQGILGRQETKKLRLFSFIIHPLLKPQVKMDLLIEIEKVLLDDAPPSEQMAVLLSLINETHLINSLFPKEFRKAMKKKIEDISKSNIIGKAIRDVIQMMTATFMAVFVATIS